MVFTIVAEEAGAIFWDCALIHRVTTFTSKYTETRVGALVTHYLGDELMIPSFARRRSRFYLSQPLADRDIVIEAFDWGVRVRDRKTRWAFTTLDLLFCIPSNHMLPLLNENNRISYLLFSFIYINSICAIHLYWIL